MRGKVVKTQEEPAQSLAQGVKGRLRKDRASLTYFSSEQKERLVELEKQAFFWPAANHIGLFLYHFALVFAPACWSVSSPKPKMQRGRTFTWFF